MKLTAHLTSEDIKDMLKEKAANLFPEDEIGDIDDIEYEINALVTDEDGNEHIAHLDPDDLSIVYELESEDHLSNDYEEIPEIDPHHVYIGDFDEDEMLVSVLTEEDHNIENLEEDLVNESRDDERLEEGEAF